MSYLDERAVRGDPGGTAPAARTAYRSEETLPAQGWTRLEFHGQINSVGPSDVHPGLARIEATVPPITANLAQGSPQEPPAAGECGCAPLVRWLLDAQALGFVTVRNDGWQGEDSS